MSYGTKLIKNAAIYSIGTVGSKLLAFLLLPIFSFFLEKEDLGLYDLVLTTIVLIVPLISFQLSDATFRWLLPADSTEEDKRKAVSSSFFLLLASTAVISALFVVGIYWFELNFGLYYLLMGVGAVYFPFIQQVVRGLGKNSLYAQAGIINAATLVSFSALFLIVLDWGLEGVFLATTLSYVFASLYAFWRGNVSSYISAKSVTLELGKEMLNYSYPLIPNASSWWLTNSANKFIILLMLGAEANGIYAISSRFPAILTILNSMFMLAWQDHAISEEEGKDQKGKGLKFAGDVFNRLVRIELTLVVLFAFCSEPLVRIFIEQDYYTSWRYMPFLFMATAMSAFSAYIGAFYLKAKKTNRIFITTTLGGFVNIIVTFALITQIGLFAPAIGTLSGFGLVFFLRYRDSRSFYPFLVKENKLLMMLALCVASITISILNLGNWRYLLIVLSFVALYLVNKDIIDRLRQVVMARLRQAKTQ